jgi:polyhydroxyalkanoate synthesis regulator phasin
MNLTQENLNQLLEDILLELSVEVGVVDLTNEEHLNKLKTHLYRNGLMEFIELLPEGVQHIVDEADDNKIDKVLKMKVSGAFGKQVTVATALGYEKDDDFAKSNLKRSANRAAKALLRTNKIKMDDLDFVDAPERESEPNIFSKEKQPSKTKKQEPKPEEPKKTKPTDKPQPSAQNQKAGDSSSFKAAFASTTKQKGDKIDSTLSDKAKESGKALDICAEKSAKVAASRGVKVKKGFIYLENEKGSNKYVEVNVNDLKKALATLFAGGKLDAAQRKLLNQTTKFVTNPENGDVKMYFTRTAIGRHPQQGYESIQLAADNLPMVNAVKEFALKNGLNVGKSSEGAIGKKVFTPLKMVQAVNPSQPESKLDIAEQKDGSVKVGNVMMKKMKIPDVKKLAQALVDKGLDKTEAARQAKYTVNQIKAYNGRLDDLVTARKDAEKEGKPLTMVNFGDVTTAEGRRKVASSLLEGVTKNFKNELDKYAKEFGKDDLTKTPENKAIFKTLEELKTFNQKYDLQTDEGARRAYKKKLDELLLNMANSPDFKDSVADFTELKAGLQFLSEGKQVLFPSSENFKTADIIVLPDDIDVKPKKGETIEQAIAKNLQFYNVSLTYVGGLSVKYKGGGGSAGIPKIMMTEYKHPNTKKEMLAVQDIYGLAYPKNKDEQQNISDGALKQAEGKLKKFVDYAVKAGIITAEEAKKAMTIGTAIGTNMGDKLTKAGVAACGGAKGVKNFKRALQLHHSMMHLTALINNRDMDYTRFSNFNEEISVNKDSIATAVKDDIADGVSTPCYMSPHHDPGFTISASKKTGCKAAAPTNQNPSHIVSEEPDLLKRKV